MYIAYLLKKLRLFHPSLLPLYRGATPIQHALFNGDKKTGVSMLKVSKGFDKGDIIAQEELDIGSDESYETLHDRLALLACTMMEDYIFGKFEKNKKVVQIESEGTPAPKFKPEDNLVLFRAKKLTGIEIYNLYRGFKGSSLKSIRFLFDNKYYFIDDCKFLSLGELELLSESQPRYKIVTKVYEILKDGDIWYFDQIKKLKNKLCVKMEGGWLIINSGHFASDHIKRSQNFIRLNLNKENYTKSFMLLAEKEEQVKYKDLLINRFS